MSSDANSNERQAEQGPSVPPLNPSTPPTDVRTDPDRGTGELGTEGLDPSQPLP
jgi:hypothetical protein